MASLEEFAGDLSMGEYEEDLMAGLDPDALGAAFQPGAEPVDIMDLIRDPRRLNSAKTKAAEAARRNRSLSKKHRTAGNNALAKAHHGAYLQHAATSATLGTAIAMHLHSRANKKMRANYVTGVSFEGVLAGAPTDTATLKSPINDQPWHITAWMGTITQLVNFNVTLWQPTGPDIVTYGAAGVSYATTTPTAGFPAYFFAMENYSLAHNPGWAFAPWQRPGYVFGGSATMQMRFQNTATTTQSLRFLLLGQCSPCNPEKLGDGQRWRMEKVGSSWHGMHSNMVF